MKTIRLPALTAVSMTLAACMQGEARDAPPVSPAVEVIGEARDCLPLTQYSTTRIRDDWTIDFIGGAGNDVWRVTLPNRCNGLKAADSFTFETSLTSLCRTDIIYPLRQYGGGLERGGGCGMGPFVPVRLAR
jgi:hypothetical protein